MKTALIYSLVFLFIVHVSGIDVQGGSIVHKETQFLRGQQEGQQKHRRLQNSGRIPEDGDKLGAEFELPKISELRAKDNDKDVWKQNKGKKRVYSVPEKEKRIWGITELSMVFTLLGVALILFKMFGQRKSNGKAN